MPPVKFEPTFTHYQMLFCAESATFLELRSGLRTHGFPEDYDWPAIPLREAKRSFLELFDAGFVEILGEQAQPLSQAKARSEITRDGTSEPKFPDAQDYYEVALTDIGVTALRALRPRFRDIGLVEPDK
jgi:hypothetical protein